MEKKRNKCKQCDYASSYAGHLRRHLKTHNGEKSNKCNQCDYAFSRVGNLRTHLKTHSGEKSKKCSQCDYKTSRADVLRRHLNYPQKIKVKKSNSKQCCSAIVLCIKADKALTNPNEKAPKSPSGNKIDPNRCCSVIVLCAYTDSNRPKTHQTAYNLHIHSFMMMRRAE